MTVMAGIFARSEAHPIPVAVCEAMERALSRHPDERRTNFRSDRVFLSKVDINAFGQPAFHVEPSGAVSMLVGEPLLRLADNDLGRSRSVDLELLHHDWESGSANLLTRARGTFAAAHYSPQHTRLTLATDKLGVRPLYLWAGEDFVYFATALRILEALGAVAKRMDLRAVTEIAHLQYPLADRTPYCGITALRPAEVVTLSGQEISRTRYWRWDTIPTSSRPEAELVRQTYELFQTAVQCRLRSDRTTFAMLSGGLDSRSIVGMLRDLGATVHSFNFAAPGTQDRTFGAGFAHAAGTIHTEWTLKADWDDAFAALQEVSDAWDGSQQRKAFPPERPLLAWGGNGGSVALGHVHHSPRIAELLRRGRRDEAINEFLDDKSVIRNLMHVDVREWAPAAIREGIRQELDDIHCQDPARAFSLFLLFNEQRRQLSEYFENIDLHRLDPLLPFFDSDFLASILEAPLDLCLGHRFYMKWLKHFPPALTSVPWQTYPGHEACPVPVEDTLRHQWDRNRRKGWAGHARKRRLLRAAFEMLTAGSFPRPIINRKYLLPASLMYQTGLGDYGYAIEIAHVYFRYWISSRGNYSTSCTTR